MVAFVDKTTRLTADFMNQVNNSIGSQVPGGRLTLNFLAPVADQAGATSTFYVPYSGGQAGLILVNSFGELAENKPFNFLSTAQTLADATKSPAPAVANSTYDMFLWDDVGTIRCTRGPVWASSTARAAAGALAYDALGRLANQLDITNGPKAFRGLYVGTIATDISNTINDTIKQRQVWNNYNRIRKPVVVTEALTSWTYNTNAFRIANNNLANSIQIVQGLAEDLIELEVLANASSTVASSFAASGIGINTGTVNSAQLTGPNNLSPVVNSITTLIAKLRTTGLGNNFYLWLENGMGAPGTTTWVGGNVFTGGSSGMAGSCSC